MVKSTALYIFYIFSLKVFLSAGEAVPFQAALIIDNTKFCSGALISPQYILTAANCVIDAFQVSVTLGTTTLTATNNTPILSDEIMIHEHFDGDKNDIALIKLPQEVTLNDSVNTIPIYLTPNFTIDVMAVLWGWTNADNQLYDDIRYSAIELQDYTYCKNINMFSEEMMLCSGNYDIGDMGSPLVISNEEKTIFRLLGSLSVNNHENIIYTKTAFYIDWLRSNVPELDVSFV